MPYVNDVNDHEEKKKKNTLQEILFMKSLRKTRTEIRKKKNTQQGVKFKTDRTISLEFPDHRQISTTLHPEGLVGAEHLYFRL